MNHFFILVTLAAMLGAPTSAGNSATSSRQATRSQTATGATATAAHAVGSVAATVGDHVITVAEVQAEIAAQLQNRFVDRQALPFLHAQALDQLVQQRLGQNYLARVGHEVSDAEIEAERRQLTAMLQAQQATIDDFLRQRGWTEETLRGLLAWRIGWPKHVKRLATDEALERYFQDHRQSFDGSQIKVSHILWRTPGPRTVDKVNQIAREAQTVRQQIVDGKLAFAEAAARYSDAPSRRQGGDLGFIPRHGLVDETFAAGAFAVKQGQISAPVPTQFGIHLIHCTEVRPGAKPWTDSRDEIQQLFARELFAKIAAEEIKTTGVKYTGLVPYFKSGTQTVVERQPESATDTGPATPSD